MLKASIMKNEGFSKNIYKDSLGKDTVGYGFLLEALSEDELALNNGVAEPMSKEAANKILDLKLKKLKKEVLAALPWLEDLEPEVKDVVFEMAYQMGINGMLGFKKSLSEIKNKNYALASENLLRSKWALQTPARAAALANKLKGVA